MSDPVISRRALDTITEELWPTLDVRCALLHDTSTAAPQVSDEFLTDINIAANEVTDAEYDRLVCEGVTAEWDAVDQRFRFHLDTLVWEGLTAGGVSGYVFYVHVTDDTDSWIIRAQDGMDPQTFDGSDFPLAVSADGLFTKAQAV
jgi:hypothetical protein